MRGRHEGNHATERARHSLGYPSYKGRRVVGWPISLRHSRQCVDDFVGTKPLDFGRGSHKRRWRFKVRFAESENVIGERHIGAVAVEDNGVEKLSKG